MNQIETITVKDFKTIVDTEVDNSKVAMINVCSAAEHEACCIKGVKNIPLSEIQFRLNEFAGKDKIYLHCFSGARSQYAAELLKSLGVEAEIVNVEGGLAAWLAAGFATENN